MDRREKSGFLAVTGAYLLWGVLPLFWNLLAEVPPVYILAQRIAWSAVFLALYMAATHRLAALRPVLRRGKTLRICLICGVLITINWGLYIYAVNSGHLLDASMGYFLEPVLVALIGILAFRERPSVLEKLTFAFAAAGLVYLVVRAGRFPWLALVIAGSFALYGAVKKQSDLPAYAALFAETLCMTPLALCWIVWADVHGTGGLAVLHGPALLLLVASGIVTSVPLLLFNIGVREIPYYVTGILMYMNPTMQFLVGLLVLKEPMDPDRLIAFVLIWAGIVFTIADRVLRARRACRAAAPAAH